MIPCTRCGRHVREADAACPFCGADRAPSAYAVGLLGTALTMVVLAACYGSPYDMKPVGDDTGLWEEDCSGGIDDRDHDGLPNGTERRVGTDPDDPDSDGDGLSDQAEAERLGTDPLVADGDGGGTSDGVEHRVDGTDSADPADDVPDLYDGDADGLPDREEASRGSDPTRADTDADGLSDADEAWVHHTDPTHADTDRDGARDLEEVLSGTSPFDPCDTPDRPDPVDTADTADTAAK